MNCGELFVDDIVRVFPIPGGQIQHQLPEVARTRKVTFGQIGFEDRAAFQSWLATKSYFSFVDADDDLLLITLRDAIVVDIHTERDIHGYQYTITFSLHTLYNNDIVQSAAAQLRRYGHDFIVEREDGNYGLLRYFGPAQNVDVDVSEGDGEHGVSIKVTMKNVTGLQELTDGGSSSSSSS